MRTLRFLPCRDTVAFMKFHAADASYTMPKASFAWFCKELTQAEPWRLGAEVSKKDGVCHSQIGSLGGTLLGGLRASGHSSFAVCHSCF